MKRSLSFLILGSLILCACTSQRSSPAASARDAPGEKGVLMHKVPPPAHVLADMTCDVIVMGDPSGNTIYHYQCKPAEGGGDPGFDPGENGFGTESGAPFDPQGGDAPPGKHGLSNPDDPSGLQGACGLLNAGLIGSCNGLEGSAHTQCEYNACQQTKACLRDDSVVCSKASGPPRPKELAVVTTRLGCQSQFAANFSYCSSLANAGLQKHCVSVAQRHNASCISK